MILTIQRLYHNNHKTISQWDVDSDVECLGLEDTFRAQKIKGQTRISAGVYRVRVKKYGRLYDKYIKRFPNWFEGSLELENVQNYAGIIIHIGNDKDDTDGCPLTGTYFDKNLDVKQSTRAYEKLYKKVIKSAKKGLLVVIVKDELKLSLPA